MISNLVLRHRIKSLLDLPCGDFNWMKKVDLHGTHYMGGDIVSELIESNKKKYQKPGIEFHQMDLLHSKLPRVDLVLVRDCLVHLSFEDCNTALYNLKRSDSKYILTTTFPQTSVNKNIETGDFRRINLNSSPFDFPRPLEIYSENHDIEKDPRKCLGLWAISSL